jgi:hypothetical protein
MQLPAVSRLYHGRVRDGNEQRFVLIQNNLATKNKDELKGDLAKRCSEQIRPFNSFTAPLRK